jgi:hypothetical protein
MGPYNTPWLTFLAWILAFGCILASIIWALWIFKPGSDDDE